MGQIKYVLITIMTLNQQARMMLLPLIHDCQNAKGLLNFVRERIIKLVYGINLLGTAFLKHKLSCKLLKPQLVLILRLQVHTDLNINNINVLFEDFLRTLYLSR